AHHQEDLEPVEKAWGRGGIAGRDRVEQEAQDHGQEQVEGDEHAPLDVDPAPRPDQRDKEGHQHRSTAANSGVKRRARTGAMFSMTLCLASTSHAPTMTAPIAPHGSSHVVRKSSMSSPSCAQAKSTGE